MRWLLTNAAPELAAALRAEGQTVIEGPFQADASGLEWLREARDVPGRPDEVDPVTWALQQSAEPEEDREIKDFRFRDLLNSTEFDVLVITPMLQPGFGFPRGPLHKWKNRVGRRGIAIGIAQDPVYMAAAKQGAVRACAVRAEHVDIYVTDDAATAARQATQRRTALWAGGSAAPIIAAVENAMTKNYQAGRRAKPWA